MSNVNNIVSDRATNIFKIIDYNNNNVLEITPSNELKIGDGANEETLIDSTGQVLVLTSVGLTTIGGKYSQFSPDISVDGNDSRTSLINTGSSVGSNVFDADSLSVGDVYHILIKGQIETDNKRDLQIRVLLGATVVFDTTLTEFADTNSSVFAYEAEIDIFVKSVGASASIYTNGQSIYLKNDNENGFRGKSSQTDSTINTTVSNTIDIDAVWETAADADEVITCKTITITKTY